MKRYVKAIKKRSVHVSNRFQEALNILIGRKNGPLDTYTKDIPSAQNALNLFPGEWISRLPDSLQNLQAGEVPLFEDDKITWMIKKLGGIEGKHILELGPLEGGHAYMLQKQGAAQVLSIEANPKAYLRCLVIKQLLHLDKVQFVYGDFMPYLKDTNQLFDLCVASGVLYHMSHPVELIALAAKCSSKLFIWTHYYDPKICSSMLLKPRFSTHSQANYQGFNYTLHRYQYKSARSWKTFIGGPENFSNWLSREDILACCRHFGFKDIQMGFESPDHPHGPSFAFLASK